MPKALLHSQPGEFANQKIRICSSRGPVEKGVICGSCQFVSHSLPKPKSWSRQRPRPGAFRSDVTRSLACAHSCWLAGIA